MSEILYKKGGPYRRPEGATYKMGPVQSHRGTDFQYMGVSDDAEMQKAIDDGWCLTVEEAINGKKEVVVDDGENFKRYEELTNQEKAEILADLEQMDAKAVREKYNVHHFTLKKIKSELD